MSTPIIDNNALTAALRALKLGGMLQTLDARLAQARAGELGHLEFLQVLCHDEISRRETTSIARRTRRARFEETLTLEGFDFTANPKLPAAQIRDLAALRWLQAGESVILHGPPGRSWLALRVPFLSCVEQSSLFGFHLDTQSLAAAAVDIDRLQVAALDLVQHRLPGHVQGGCGVVEQEPAVGYLRPDPVPQLLVDANPPG